MNQIAIHLTLLGGLDEAVIFTILITAVGWAGAVSVLAAYLLLLRRRTTAESHLYLSLNFAGSACLAVSTSIAHAWASAAVNLIWLVICVAPLVRAWVSFQNRYGNRGGTTTQAVVDQR